jgi:endonuclease/exonuclease/phosphatase family metal-dependent hydrolase
MSPALPGRPRPAAWLLFMAAAMALLGYAPTAPAQPKSGKTYLLCFWNVENLFDDKVNPKLENPIDREFDNYFAKNKEALRIKLSRLGEVLIGLNGGKGPDILAMAEVESARAAELVMQELNRRLKDKSLHYKTVVFKDPEGGRSIGTAVVTRLKVKEDRTRLLGKHQRILKVHIEAEGKELIVVASHWASRVSDADGRRRAGYANMIFGDFKAAFKANPKVDYLVCGDFNDNPTDKAVTNNLNASGDLKKVLATENKPIFFNPFAALFKKGEGSHFFRDKPLLFDQILLSPGLLDGEGWSYKNNSATIIKKFVYKGRPDRFGGKNDRRPWRNRGASDHFPVTVEFRINK